MSKYDEIIALPHHVSQIRARMPEKDRAAQFSSFAALTGYEDCISEAARLTQMRLELSESEAALLDKRLGILETRGVGEEISLLYFKADEHKAGGVYLRHKGRFRRVDREKESLVFEDKSSVPLRDIYEIDGEIFKGRPK